MGLYYGWILLITVIFSCPSHCQSDCKNVVCQPQLDCRYPRVTVVLPDPENKDCCNITECICEGTSSRLSTSSNPDEHYESLRALYENCTMVEGNLEIVYVHPKEGFNTVDVTKHIRIVTGYVLISVNYIEYINLNSLRLIRGEHLYVDNRTTRESCGKVIPDDSQGYALYISANYRDSEGLRGVHLPSLSEIMRGRVKITDNRHLCFVNTIIFAGEIFNSDTQRVEIGANNRSCPSCPKSCINSKINSSEGHCWGNSDSLCQKFTKLTCKVCPQRCNLLGECCESYCAAGCTAKRECHACKGYNDFGKCVAKCDTGSTSSGREVIGGVDKSRVKYELFWFCVKKCPATRRIFERDRKCVLTCPKNYFSENGYCKECPVGGCSHICYGLEAKLGPLRNDEMIHSVNIGNFTKNCTIIEGSLIFRQGTFLGDKHCDIPGINSSSNALDVFENVEEITGFLNIEYWPLKDLCLFKNLKRIRGIERWRNAYSLLVMTDAKDLRQLCFNSLERIESGYVSIGRNRGLCYVKTVQWDPFFLQSYQESVVLRNKRKCSNLPCNRNCNPDHGCWGPGNEQCVTCKNFTDYTNATGLFVSKWVIDPDTGKSVPGHNVTTCVETCDTDKGVYPTSDKKCYPCDPECNKTCSGPGPTNCTAMSGSLHGCKNVKYGTICKANCPESYYQDENGLCQKCSDECLDGGCDGPADGYQNDGCSVCHMKYDVDGGLVTYRGHACQICVNELKDSECALGCTHNNVTGVYECYKLPSNAHVTWIIIGCVILAVMVVITVVLLRCKKKIQKMRKHIGDKITGDATQPDELETPLTPSGTAPNQAQLRIVKENELALGKELGSGAFGSVYKAVWTSMHIQGEPIKIPVAVKQLKTFSHNNEIMDEAYVMASVDSPYLIRLLGICMTEQVSLITQLMPLGSLLEYVRGHADNIGAVNMLTWCKQIAKGMQYLEEKHLVHRDLAARNVLVKTPHHVKITDFGLSKMLNATQSVYLAEGGKLPIKWLAMECIMERKFSHQSDVWAFGVTCWEIFTFGAKPYDGVRAVDVLQLLERGDRLAQPPVCTIEVYMLLIKCWLVDPLSRPKFVELVEEFTNMCKDHQRFVVVKNDPNRGITSPNPEEEKRFFERLIREDNVDFDGELMLDDPDTYLLSRAGVPEEPVYQNRPAVEQHASNGTTAGGQGRHNRLFSRNTPSAQLPTPPAHVHMSPYDPMTSEVARINSRTSDSSNPDDVFANSGNSLHSRLGKSMAVDLPPPGKGADQHVVRYRPSQAGASWATQGRKDSEENSRYTEDPTRNNRNSLGDPIEAHSASSREIISTSDQPDGMVYDEEEYLIPTPGIQSHPAGLEDYIDPPTPEVQGVVRPVTNSSSSGFQGSLSNNTYLESEDMRPLQDAKETHPSSWPNRFCPQNQQSEAEYVNSAQDHEYLNCDNVRGDTMMSDVLLQSDAANRPLLENQHSYSTGQGRRDFNNEEYMTADSGIGEDNHSVLSGSNGAQGNSQRQAARIRQNSSLSSGGSSNGSLGPLITGSPVHRARLSSDEQQTEIDRGVVRYKGTPRPKTQSKRLQKNSSIGLDNPEYMMLQESVSDGKVLLDLDTRSTDA